jgi:peroxiredoxin
MLKLGTPIPKFSLKDVTTGEEINPNSFEDKKALLVMFICRHCPFVYHVQDEIASIGHDYLNKDIGIIAISSNDVGDFPEDRPQNLKIMAKEMGNVFPYCYDESQEVAKAFTAACTPDFFLFDKERKLVYRGQLDDSRPGNGVPTTGEDLRSAIEAVLDDKPVNPVQKPNVGCNIKWRSGNEPDYFNPPYWI